MHERRRDAHLGSTVTTRKIVLLFRTWDSSTVPTMYWHLLLYTLQYSVWRMAYGVWRMTYYGVWRMACGVQVPTNRHRHRMHVELLVTIYHRHTNRHAASVTTTNNILLFTQQQPPPCCLVRSCAWLVKLRLQEHVPPCEALLWRSFPPKIGCWEKARPKRRLDW